MFQFSKNNQELQQKSEVVNSLQRNFQKTKRFTTLTIGKIKNSGLHLNFVDKILNWKDWKNFTKFLKIVTHLRIKVSGMRYSIPNQLTIIRILLTPVFVFYFLKGGQTNIRIASLVYLIASVTDWYDGYIARRLQMITRLGQFMDPLADKILVSAALAVFAYENYLQWTLVILIIARDFLITGLRLFALYIGKPIITSVLAKWKTFLQMAFIFALLIYLNIPGAPDIRLNQVQNPYLVWTSLVMYVIVLLTVISGVQYLIVNRSHAQELFKRLFLLLTRPFQSKGD